MNQEIIFIIIDSVEGGYEASALGHSIFTQAETYDALKLAIRDSMLCHFDEAEIPRVIRLHYVRDEVMAV